MNSSSKKKKPTTRKRKRAKDTNGLLAQVVQLTGLPSRTIKRELKAILDRKNIDANNLTLDELRCVVASYLREIMGGLLDGHPHPKSNEPHHH